MPDRRQRRLTFPPQVTAGGNASVLLPERPASPPDAADTPRAASAQATTAAAAGRPRAPVTDRAATPLRMRAADRAAGRPGGPRVVHGGEAGPGRPRHPEDNPFAAAPGGHAGPPLAAASPGAATVRHAHSGRAGPGIRGDRSPWATQWSDRQPGRAPRRLRRAAGWRRPGPGAAPRARADRVRARRPRWDPTDPAQRRARYALLTHVGLLLRPLHRPSVALLLGAWPCTGASSACGAKPHTASDPDNPAPPRPPTDPPPAATPR
ncbi:hypothetical protein SALBM311S_10904 [Streptomyces alboniger]